MLGSSLISSCYSGGDGSALDLSFLARKGGGASSCSSWKILWIDHHLEKGEEESKGKSLYLGAGEWKRTERTTRLYKCISPRSLQHGRVVLHPEPGSEHFWRLSGAPCPKEGEKACELGPAPGQRACPGRETEQPSFLRPQAPSSESDQGRGGGRGNGQDHRRRSPRQI